MRPRRKHAGSSLLLDQPAAWLYIATAVLLWGVASSSLHAQGTVTYGKGLRSISGELRNTCVGFTRPDEDAVRAKLRGLAFDYKLRSVESLDQAREVLQMSFDASAHGLWGSVSTSADYFKSVEVNQYSLYMLIYARLLAEPIGIEAHPDPSAIRGERGQRLKPKEILARCGDSYISGIQYGGAIYGMLIVDTRSRTEKERLRGELQGSFSAGINANASAQRTLEHALRNTSYYITYHQEGGRFSSPPPSSFKGIEAFFEWARVAEKVILDSPAIMSISTMPLNTVYPDVALPSTANQIDILRRLAGRSLEERSRSKDLRFIFQYPERFPDAPRDAIRKARSDVDALIDETSFLFQDCLRDESLCSKRAFQNLEKAWARLNTPLPSEEPLYGTFDFGSYEEQWRAFGRRLDCNDRWEWRMRLGRLEITSNKSRLNYEFTCDRRNFCYDCHGGWDCNSGDSTPTWPGHVTADLKVDGDTVVVSNVVSPNNRFNSACEEELIRFVQSKNGALVGR